MGQECCNEVQSDNIWTLDSIKPQKPNRVILLRSNKQYKQPKMHHFQTRSLSPRNSMSINQISEQLGTVIDTYSQRSRDNQTVHSDPPKLLIFPSIRYNQNEPEPEQFLAKKLPAKIVRVQSLQQISYATIQLSASHDVYFANPQPNVKVFETIKSQKTESKEYQQPEPLSQELLQLNKHTDRNSSKVRSFHVAPTVELVGGFERPPKSRSSSICSLNSVASKNLFAKGLDDVVLEGYVYKLKPGLSSNFVKRYMQISKRAFRYFKDKASVRSNRPLVMFRKNIIKQCVPYKANKNSYLKKGSRANNNPLEHKLFDNMFEMQLNEDYEDNCGMRDEERSLKQSLVMKSSHRSRVSLGRSSRSLGSDNSSIGSMGRSLGFLSDRIDPKGEYQVKHKKVNKIKIGHAMSIRDNSKGKEQHGLQSAEIYSKEFGADDKNGVESQTWKNRAIDWYNAERRFIFAFETKQESQRYQLMINKDVVMTKLKTNLISNMALNLKQRRSVEHALKPEKLIGLSKYQR